MLAFPAAEKVKKNIALTRKEIQCRLPLDWKSSRFKFIHANVAFNIQNRSDIGNLDAACERFCDRPDIFKARSEYRNLRFALNKA